MEVHHALSSGSYRIMVDHDPQATNGPVEKNEKIATPPEQVEATTYNDRIAAQNIVAPVTDRGRLFDALL